MLLYISSFIIFSFVSFSLFFRAHCPGWLKIAGIILVFLASQKYLFYRFLGGSFFAPQMSRSAILILEAAYGVLIVLFFLLLLWDIYLFGNWILKRSGMPIPQKLPCGAIRAGLCFLALCLGIWGTWQAVKVPDAHVVEMPIAGLPRNLDGFSIAQLSDLHIGPIFKRDWLDEVVAKTNALKPDLVALTGDYVDGYASDLESEIEPLGKLQAKYGVFGVTGNHEYYWDATQWNKILEDLGVHMLENSHKALDVNGDAIVVAGVPDLVAQRFGHPAPDAQKALAGAPEALKLLLSHQPKTAEGNLAFADIQLSGHTHGGMMFFIQPLIARFNAGMVAGHYPVDGKNIYVHPGTGLWNGFSSRIGVPAEITLIILRAA